LSCFGIKTASHFYHNARKVLKLLSAVPRNKYAAECVVVAFRQDKPRGISEPMIRRRPPLPRPHHPKVKCGRGSGRKRRDYYFAAAAAAAPAPIT